MRTVQLERRRCAQLRLLPLRQRAPIDLSDATLGHEMVVVSTSRALGAEASEGVSDLLAERCRIGAHLNHRRPPQCQCPWRRRIPLALDGLIVYGTLIHDATEKADVIPTITIAVLAPGVHTA